VTRGKEVAALAQSKWMVRQAWAIMTAELELVEVAPLGPMQATVNLLEMWAALEVQGTAWVILSTLRRVWTQEWLEIHEILFLQSFARSTLASGEKYMAEYYAPTPGQEIESREDLGVESV